MKDKIVGEEALLIMKKLKSIKQEIDNVQNVLSSCVSKLCKQYVRIQELTDIIMGEDEDRT